MPCWKITWWAWDEKRDITHEALIGPSENIDREGLASTTTQSLLVWDSFSAHLTDTVKQQLRENKTATTVIPGGLTSLVQPLDVCLNKPFKARLREKWMTWMMSGEKTFTPGGQLQAASLVTVCQWVKESWQELSKEMVECSFRKCGISNALDGTEDDLVWEEEEDSSQVEEEPDCDVYDDRITPEQWQELFGESDDEEEFHGFWRKTNKQTNSSFRSHQIWEKKWPMLHRFEISFNMGSKQYGVDHLNMEINKFTVERKVYHCLNQSQLRISILVFFRVNFTGY